MFHLFSFKVKLNWVVGGENKMKKTRDETHQNKHKMDNTKCQIFKSNILPQGKRKEKEQKDRYTDRPNATRKKKIKRKRKMEKVGGLLVLKSDGKREITLKNTTIYLQKTEDEKQQNYLQKNMYSMCVYVCVCVCV